MTFLFKKRKCIKQEWHVLLIGWTCVVWHRPVQCVCFLFIQPRLCMNTELFYAQNRQLAHHKEIFNEFDKVYCIENAHTSFKNF